MIEKIRSETLTELESIDNNKISLSLQEVLLEVREQLSNELWERTAALEAHWEVASRREISRRLKVIGKVNWTLDVKIILNILYFYWKS